VPEERPPEELLLVRKTYINNFWRYEFYVPWADIYINVSGISDEEARERARAVLELLSPREGKPGQKGS